MMPQWKELSWYQQWFTDRASRLLCTGDTCHTESCHYNVDRLLPNIDEAKQKHKAFHTWLMELLKIVVPGINMKKRYSGTDTSGNVRSQR